MNFDNEYEESVFLKGIKSKSLAVNMSALNKANELIANGCSADFVDVLEDNRNLITEKLESVLYYFPFENPDHYEFFKGGERTCQHLLEAIIHKPTNTNTLDERKSIIANLDAYMSGGDSVDANKVFREELNISKTQYELYKKMLDSDFFDPHIAIAINEKSDLLDRLSPAYVREFMSSNDVTAVISILNRDIEGDYTFKDLAPEVKRFVKTSQTSVRSNEELFAAMTIFANSAVYGVDEEAVYDKLLLEAEIDESTIEKYYKSLEAESKIKHYKFGSENSNVYSIEQKLESDDYLTDEEKAYAAEFDAEFDELENEGKKRKRAYRM